MVNQYFDGKSVCNGCNIELQTSLSDDIREVTVFCNKCFYKVTIPLKEFLKV